MPALLKNLYSEKFFTDFLIIAESVTPNFNKISFLDSIFDENWDKKELKQRMRHISTVLHTYLEGEYTQQVSTLLKFIDKLQQVKATERLEYLFFPDFIEVYGLEDYNTSVYALEKITKFTSCEFAVRPFIVKHKEKMMAQMQSWALHKNKDVRRLASEGCRPRLPWAKAIQFLKENPKPILPILETLKNDTSEYVRRSVANNLNDISKDHPEIVISIAEQWTKESKNTKKLIKHACRTLLKQAEPKILTLFGFGTVKNIKIENFNLKNTIVKIGEVLQFSLHLINTSTNNIKIRLEYAVYYQKANGKRTRKIYKISEKNYTANSTTKIERKQSFKTISTRKFHVGKHQVSVIINGAEFCKTDFSLIN